MGFPKTTLRQNTGCSKHLNKVTLQHNTISVYFSKTASVSHGTTIKLPSGIVSLLNKVILTHNTE